MKYSDLTEEEKTFIAYMEKARTQNPALYLAAIAIGCASGAAEDIDWAREHTRDNFERAMCILRDCKNKAPQLAALYEDAITFIQMELLHRKVGAAVCSNLAAGSEVGAYG